MPLASKTLKLKENLSARLEYDCEIFSPRPVDGGWGGFTQKSFHENVRFVLLGKDGNVIGECPADSIYRGTDMPAAFGVDRDADIASVEFYSPQRSRLQVKNSAYDAEALKSEAKKLADECRPHEAREMLEEKRSERRKEKMARAREILGCRNVFPDEKALKKWAEQYNDLMNEGGYGHVPMAVTQADVEWARQALRADEEETAAAAPVA